MVAALELSPFFLGGALMCFGTGFKHTLLAKRTKLKPAHTVKTKL
jgi:hypothetical protein